MTGPSRPERVALVTGCGKPQGIGGATALLLGRLGFKVMATDVEPGGATNVNEQPEDVGEGWEGLPGLQRQIERAGGQAATAVGDISREDDAQRLVDETIATFGRIDVLVNNAGAPQEPMTDFEDIDVAVWDKVVAINLRGTFLMSRAAVRPMRAQQWGRIINMSSIVGKKGRAKRPAYSATKAGILGLTRALAQEVAADGVTVNAICPGAIFTTRTLSSVRRDGADTEAILAERLSRVPAGRWGGGDDIAGAVAFFASDASAFVTGQALNVDGGSLTV